MLDMTTVTFVPQPYALFGVLVERADEPARFEPALDPIRLVLGWSRDENGGLWPVLSGGPLEPFTDPVLNETERAAAANLVREFEKAARGSVRTNEITQVLDRVERWFGRVDARLGGWAADR
jgi:hypothetical protein